MTTHATRGNIPTIKDEICVLICNYLIFERSPKMQSDELYDKLCRLLTDYETRENSVDIKDFYFLLVEIQNNWELMVTSK